MIKRTLCLAILVTLALGLALPATLPAAAAPTSAASDVPNASLLPADTAIFVDVRTAELTTTVNSVLDLVEKVTGSRPTNIYADINRGLTQALGREATFEKDVLPWLGDHLTIGIPVTDKQLADAASGSTQAGEMFRNPDVIAILSVKDDAAAGSFMKELMGNLGKNNMTFNSRADDVAGNKATVWDQGGMCETTCGTVVQAKGFFAFGRTLTINPWLASLKAKKPTLAGDANFGKLLGALKPNNLVTVFLSPRFYQFQMSTVANTTARSRSGAATPEAGQTSPAWMKLALGAIQGQAFGLRHDGKLLALDVVQSIDMQALAKLYQGIGLSDQAVKAFTPKPIDAKLAGQVPAKAMVSIIGGGLSGLYDGLKAALAAMSKASANMGARGQQEIDQFDMGLRRIEAALKLAFDLDLRNDILSWMTGEFAVYVVYNPNSVLTKMPNSQAPLDLTLLVQTGDSAKTKNFLTKLNAGLTKNAKVTPESAGDNLYRVTPQNGPTLAYGLVGDTFLLTTSSGLDTARGAIKGDGVLSSSPAWKNAQASMVKPTGEVVFVNFSEIAPVVKAAMAAQSGVDRGGEQAVALLNQFESLSVTGGVMQPDGLSSASIQLIFK